VGYGASSGHHERRGFVSIPRIVLASIGAAAALAVLAVLPATAATSGHTALVQSVTVTVTKAAEFKFKLSKVSLKKGVVSFKFTNGGNLPHDLKVCSSNKGTLVANTCTGRSTPLVSPGASNTLRVTFLRSGTYEYLCTVPGHAAAGMKGLIKVS
jgi:uncharacterized cupredoxin-like copper-binding protein